MGENQHMKRLVERFINNTISESEFEELFRYIDSLDLEKAVKDSMNKRWEEINSKENSTANKELLDVILEKIETGEPKHKVISLMSKWYSIAAMIAIIFGAGYIYNSAMLSTGLEVVTPSPNEEITLQLDNGEVKIISDQVNEQIVNNKGLVVGNHNRGAITYENNISEEKLAYNTLTVPYGKRFQVVLSDGTKVHLNAGTSMKYPVKFVKGLKREVYLNGEAFFDVTRDKEHPFLVNSNDLSVKVLGTKFNVTSYPENETINTVLIEGSVEVFEKENALKTPIILKPGFKASWIEESKNITISKVNTEQYTAWMEGKLILNEVTFEDIQLKLERQYNVTFINTNEELKRRRFTARFDIENIDQVMKSLSISASFNYSLTNNEIIIN